MSDQVEEVEVTEDEDGGGLTLHLKIWEGGEVALKSVLLGHTPGILIQMFEEGEDDLRFEVDATGPDDSEAGRLEIADILDAISFTLRNGTRQEEESENE